MMFTGPEVVVKRRERMRAVPSEGGSTEDSREFLTAKPTPCTRCSSGIFPQPEEGIVLFFQAAV